MKKRIIFVLLIGLILTFGCLTACTPEDKPESFTVTYHYNYDDKTETKEVEKGKTAPAITPEAREDYDFGGWYSDKAFVAKFEFATIITADTELYAKWTAKETPPPPAKSYAIVRNTPGCTLVLADDETWPGTATGDKTFKFQVVVLDDYLGTPVVTAEGTVLTPDASGEYTAEIIAAEAGDEFVIEVTGLEYVDPVLRGESSEANPFKIVRREHLSQIASEVNKGNKVFSEGYYLLTRDIDLGGAEWTPIGSGKNAAFAGVFDGGGHTVKNWKITGATDLGPDNTTQYYGFFGYTYQAIVRNFGVEEFEIAFESDLDKFFDIGGLMAVNYGGVVSYCHAEGRIEHFSEQKMQVVGGLVGSVYVTGIIEYSYAAVDVTAESDFADAGGLAGNSTANIGSGYTLINCCYATGNVKGGNSAGGLVGLNLAFSVISNCYATGDVEGLRAGYASAGGLVGGCSYEAEIFGSFATGDVKNPRSGQVVSTGGIAGYLGQTGFSYADRSGRIRKSYFYEGQKVVGANNFVAGTAATKAQLTDGGFLTANLGFTAYDWSFAEGGYPVLKDSLDKPDSFKVTYNLNYVGAPASKSVTVNAGRPVSFTADGITYPKREHMAFYDWYYDMDFTDYYNYRLPVGADITLYAKWIDCTAVAGRYKSTGQAGEILLRDDGTGTWWDNELTYRYGSDGIIIKSEGGAFKGTVTDGIMTLDGDDEYTYIFVLVGEQTEKDAFEGEYKDESGKITISIDGWGKLGYADLSDPALEEYNFTEDNYALTTSGERIRFFWYIYVCEAYFEGGSLKVDYLDYDYNVEYSKLFTRQPTQIENLMLGHYRSVADLIKVEITDAEARYNGVAYDYELGGSGRELTFKVSEGSVDFTYTMTLNDDGKIVLVYEHWDDDRYNKETSTAVLAPYVPGLFDGYAGTYNAGGLSFVIVLDSDGLIREFEGSNNFGSYTIDGTKISFDIVSGPRKGQYEGALADGVITLKLDGETKLYVNAARTAYYSCNRSGFYESIHVYENGKVVFQNYSNGKTSKLVTLSEVPAVGKIIGVVFTDEELTLKIKITDQTSFIYAGAEEGVYTAGDDTLTLDGFGNAVYKGESCTYVYYADVTVLTTAAGDIGVVLGEGVFTARQPDGYRGIFEYETDGSALRITVDGFGHILMQSGTSLSKLNKPYAGAYTASGETLTATGFAASGYNTEYTFASDRNILTFAYFGSVKTLMRQGYIPQIDMAALYGDYTFAGGSLTIAQDKITGIEIGGTAYPDSGYTLKPAQMLLEFKIGSGDARINISGTELSLYYLKGFDDDGYPEYATVPLTKAGGEERGLEGDYTFAGGSLTITADKITHLVIGGTAYPEATYNKGSDGSLTFELAAGSLRFDCVITVKSEKIELQYAVGLDEYGEAPEYVTVQLTKV